MIVSVQRFAGGSPSVPRPSVSVSARVPGRTTARHAAVIVVALLIAVACSQRPPEPERAFVGTPSLPNCDLAPVRNLAASIYIDATLSMQGFVRAGPATVYIRFIEALERSFATGWSQSGIQFFRFGSKIEPVSAKGYLDALEPAFYHEPGIFERTEIDRVLQRASTDSMLVIVTDLYQHDSNVAKMVRALRDHALAKRLTFAILGLRSPFDGTIYDVTPARLSFTWRGLRPFYALIVGRQPDVLRYLDELKRTVTAGQDAGTLVVSPCLLARPLGWSRDAQVKVAPPIRVNTSVPPRQDGSIGGFDLRKADTGGTITVTIPVLAIPDSPGIRFEQLRDERKARLAPRRGFSWFSWGAPAVADADTSSLVPKLASLSADRVEIAMQLPAFGSRPAGVYMYQVRLFVPPSALVLPKWCSEWSVSAQQLSSAIQNNRFDGSRTQNLFEFVSDATTAMVNQEPREVGRLEVYLAFDP